MIRLKRNFCQPAREDKPFSERYAISLHICGEFRSAELLMHTERATVGRSHPTADTSKLFRVFPHIRLD